MGGMTSVLSALPAVVGGVEGVMSARSRREERRDEMRSLERQQAEQMRQAESAAALEREQLAVTTQNAEEERRAALRRAMARQRASFGAQGVGSGGGSSQAVLLGMFEESDGEKVRRERLDNLRLRVIEDDLAGRRANNILRRTELAEKNRLDKLAEGRGIIGRAGDRIIGG